MSIRYLPGTLDDLNEALAYYNERNPDAAQRFANVIRTEEQTILDFPEIALTLGSNLRVLRVSKFPYSLVYRAVKGNILIVAVAHHKRRPGYWKTRLGSIN